MADISGMEDQSDNCWHFEHFFSNLMKLGTVRAMLHLLKFVQWYWYSVNARNCCCTSFSGLPHERKDVASNFD
jgi:hypothetical protein